MLRRLTVAMLLLVPLVVPAGAGSSPLVSSGAGRQAGESLGTWLIVLKDSADAGAVSAVTQRASALGASVTGSFDRLRTLAVRLPLSDVEALRHDPNVAYVVADRPLYLIDDLWPLEVSGAATTATEPVPPGVTRIGAARPSVSTVPEDGPAARTAVAVLDTGISRRPELNVVGGHDCSGDAFSGLFGSDSTEDRSGHGTHVAGIIGAGASRSGVVGVSPGTPIYAVRVFPRFGSAHLSDIVCGLNWVTDHAAAFGIKVVNLSLGGKGADDNACGMQERNALHTAVCRVVDAGVTVVAAAGNNGGDLSKLMPASFGEILTVTAMASYTGVPGGHGSPPVGCKTQVRDETAAGFSAYAVPGSPATRHVISAPGVCITSTWNDGGTKTISGTSMAAPHVTGLVARCIDAGPCAGKSPAEIIAKLRADAADRPPDSGFAGDTRHPITGRYYGDLAAVAGY